MQFISFKFLNPPVVTPIEYSYQAEGENCIGDYTGNEEANVEDAANKNRGKPARFYAYQFFMA